MQNKPSPSPEKFYSEAYCLLDKEEKIDLNEIITNDDDGKKDLKLLLQDLQGNILQSHGRTYSIYLFLHFDKNQQEPTKKWIAYFAKEYVVSAITQRKQREEYKKNNVENLFVNFSLSFNGYEALGLDAKAKFSKLCGPIDENGNKFFNNNNPFMQELDTKLDELNYKKCGFEPEYKQEKYEIHAVILLAHSAPDALWKQTNEIIENIGDKNIKIIKREVGLLRRKEINNKEVPVEPFGFPDGISQPLFLKTDFEKVKNMEKGDPKWDPSANLRVGLNVDPFGKQFKERETGDEYSFGSFLVYQKLEQDVEGFNNKVTELACELETEGTDCPREKTEQLVRAYSMGRFREDGRPVAIYSNLVSHEESGIELNYNDFNYGKANEFREESRWKCPFHAHIRKVNSRAREDNVYDQGNYQDSPEKQRMRRIVRRGTTYGLPKENHASLLSQSTKENLERYKYLSEKLGVELQEGKEGILFFCFQSDIEEQFERLQQYANSQEFGPVNSVEFGADPIVGQIVGQNGDQTPLLSQKWPREWGKPDSGDLEFDFFGFVTPRGGEYFFTPSLSFLKSLKEG